jgi:hypothetical protein
MDYQIHSFQEQINEILGKQKKSGYWICPNCRTIKKIQHGKNKKL